MTKEALDTIIQAPGLIDLGDAILYLDEDGLIEAAFSTRSETEPGVKEEITSCDPLDFCCV
ncbi:MAG: hypothetical protein ACRDHW_09935 [Ktedonobacteraceae bacterium]